MSGVSGLYRELYPTADLSVTEEYPWLYMPEDAEPFDFLAAVDLPAIGSETIVIEAETPVGFDGVIYRLSHNIVGAGFNQGSGDIVWSLKIGLKPVKNYGQILFEFGSLAVPRPTDGILIRSGETLYYSVENVNQEGAGYRVIHTVGGYYWPTRSQS